MKKLLLTIILMAFSLTAFSQNPNNSCVILWKDFDGVPLQYCRSLKAECFVYYGKNTLFQVCGTISNTEEAKSDEIVIDEKDATSDGKTY